MSKEPKPAQLPSVPKRLKSVYTPEQYAEILKQKQRKASSPRERKVAALNKIIDGPDKEAAKDAKADLEAMRSFTLSYDPAAAKRGDVTFKPWSPVKLKRKKKKEKAKPTPVKKLTLPSDFVKKT